MAAPAPLRRNRDFTPLWRAHAVSVSGSQISGAVNPLLVLAATGGLAIRHAPPLEATA